MATGHQNQPRGLFTREQIIREAFALLEEHGPDALSMRRLAEHLGVAPNALYTHVRSKADLIDGLVDQVYAGIELDPDPNRDWTEQLVTISHDVRAHLLAHPAVVPFALQQPGLGPHSLRLGEAIYAVLRPAGFSDQATVGIVYALLTYILGFVALEIPRAGTDPQTSDEFVRRIRAFFAALPPGEFPYHVQLAPLLARISTDDQFRFGIRIFIAGLKAQQADLTHSAWTTRGDWMKAIVQERFGPPDVLRLVETDLPEVGADDVLVRVHAAALNPYDWHIMRGDPLIARLMGEMGLRKPKARVAGIDAAGPGGGGRRECARAAAGDEVLASARARSPSTPAPRRTRWCPSRSA